MSFVSVGAIESAQLWDKSLALSDIMSHTCVQCLGAAPAVTPQREHLKQSRMRAVTTIPYRDF